MKRCVRSRASAGSFELRPCAGTLEAFEQLDELLVALGASVGQ
jgi:hypothetical protein